MDMRERRKAIQAHLAPMRAAAQKRLEARYCRRPVGDLAPGAACPDCGHTSLVHPFFGNRLDHCALCELQELVAELRLG